MKQNYIYVIGHDAAFKIGFSNNPQERVKQLQTANEHQLQLLWCMQRNDAVKLEKHLHKRFNKHKQLGEWFSTQQLTLQQIINESYIFNKEDW